MKATIILATFCFVLLTGCLPQVIADMDTAEFSVEPRLSLFYCPIAVIRQLLFSVHLLWLC